MHIGYNESKLNFVIELYFNFDQVLTGGIVALHKLAYELAYAGHNVYIMTEPEYPHPNIKVIKTTIDSRGEHLLTYSYEPFTYDIETTIAIYPQITRGNPFNIKNVARWILYNTQQNIEDTFGPNDVYFNFGDFLTYREVDYKKLTVFNYYNDVLKITNTSERKGFCFINHKHTPPWGFDLINQFNATDLSNWKELGAHEYLRDELNKYEYLLIFDQKSFYPVAAGLCGCKTIILNPGLPYDYAENNITVTEQLTPEKYRELNPIHKYGVAYGLDDIYWANMTINKVTNHIKQLELLDKFTVQEFISYWKNKVL